MVEPPYANFTPLSFPTPHFKLLNLLQVNANIPNNLSTNISINHSWNLICPSSYVPTKILVGLLGGIFPLL